VFFRPLRLPLLDDGKAAVAEILARWGGKGADRCRLNGLKMWLPLVYLGAYVVGGIWRAR
jgi:hypothetical protein